MKEGAAERRTELTDAQLVRLYVESGRSEHFDQLVLRHIRRVRAMLYHMALNDADADDLTQEVFLKAMRGLPAFAGRSSFATWLYRIAMNTAYRFLSRRARSPVEVKAELPERDDWLGTPDRTTEARQLDVEIERAVQALSPTLRGAVVLMSMQGLSGTEAAAIERCPSATMHWRLHEARRLLRERLREYLPNE